MIPHEQTHSQNLIHAGNLSKALTNPISYLIDKLWYLTASGPAALWNLALFIFHNFAVSVLEINLVFYYVMLYLIFQCYFVGNSTTIRTISFFFYFCLFCIFYLFCVVLTFFPAAVCTFGCVCVCIFIIFFLLKHNGNNPPVWGFHIHPTGVLGEQ